MNWLKLGIQMMTKRKKELDMKDKIVQTLIVVSILAGFITFIAIEWEYIGKIIFALIFGPALLLPKMLLLLFATIAALITLAKVAETDE